MKWMNTSFKCKDAAEQCKEEIIEAGVKTGDIFQNDDYWYVPWMPMNKQEYETCVRIVCKHIY